jgi:tetratricopeptide (TPR) repeat protein
MASTKKKASGSPDDTIAPATESGRTAPPAKPRNIAAYEAAVEQFTAATAHFARSRFAEALPLFEAVTAASAADEPILADRARSYASICRGRIAAPMADSSDADALYHRGVVAANAGRLDEAWSFLEQAVGHRPNDASILYARATVRGLQGNAEGAASELKKSVAIDPKFRYQAASDSDFDKVRDEAAFIDIIEPSNAGA